MNLYARKTLGELVGIKQEIGRPFKRKPFYHRVDIDDLIVWGLFIALVGAVAGLFVAIASKSW